MRKTTLINNNWLFTKLPEGNMGNLPLEVNDFQPVTLPHTWYKDDDQYNGIGLYERTINIEKNPEKQYFLEFNGADRWCQVYVNGNYIGEHKGGYSTFRLEIPADAYIDGQNKISVLLDNRSHSEISPLTGDFTIYGGLYRDVNFIEVEKIHFDLSFYGSTGLIILTSLDTNGNGIIKLEPHVSNAKENIEVQYEVLNSNNEIVAKVTNSTNTTTITISNPILWNGMENPYLYTVKASIVSNNVVCDEIQIKTGFKAIEMKADTGFYLNGKHLKLNGVAKHQDDGIVFSATGSFEWKRDMECIKEIGANALRLSHYQHPQGVYDLCDNEGLVVWAEIPMLKMLDTKESFNNACEQLKELIYQNIHHPSICFWGIQNEIAIFGEEEYMYEQCKALTKIAKEIDATRLVTAANLFSVRNESELNEITDMIGYNIYFGWYYGIMADNENFVEKFHKDRPNMPLGISEYGVDCNLAYHQSTPRVKDYSEEFQALYHETVYPIFKSKDYIWGTFVWNMFDFGSARRNEGGVKYRNTKGLVCDDHASKKDSFYYYKAQWSNEPFIYIAERRFEKRATDTINVKVYSNQKEVTITLNENSYTEKSDNGVFIFKDVPLVLGANKVRAFSGSLTDVVVWTRQETPEPSYTYVDENPEINVRNWFLDDQEKDQMFPEGKLSIMSPATDIVASEKAMAVLDDWNKKVADALRARSGGMPLHRILNYMRKDIALTEEGLQELNRRLTQIKD